MDSWWKGLSASEFAAEYDRQLDRIVKDKEGMRLVDLVRSSAMRDLNIVGGQKAVIPVGGTAWTAR